MLHAGLLLESFDAARAAPESAPQPEPEPPPPVLTAEDLAAAEARGFQNGFDAAQAQQEAAAVAALARLAEAVGRIDQQVTTALDQSSQAVGEVMLAALLAAIPPLRERLGADHAKAFAEIVIRDLPHDWTLGVHVHPSIMEELRARLVGPMRFVFHAREDLAPGDIDVTWEDGKAVLRGADTDAQIRSALESWQLIPRDRTDTPT